MNIKIKLSDIVSDYDLPYILGLNPYCMNEGSRDDWIEVHLDDDKFDSLIKLIKESI